MRSLLLFIIRRREIDSRINCKENFLSYANKLTQIDRRRATCKFMFLWLVRFRVSDSRLTPSPYRIPKRFVSIGISFHTIPRNSPTRHVELIYYIVNDSCHRQITIIFRKCAQSEREKRGVYVRPVVAPRSSF